MGSIAFQSNRIEVAELVISVKDSCASVFRGAKVMLLEEKHHEFYCWSWILDALFEQMTKEATDK
jgi:formylmethanofuran dehydrogenase subunit B